MQITSNISYAAFYECKLDLYLPDRESFKVIIFFHGGGLEAGTKSDNKQIFSELVKNGIAVISADYRMYPCAKYPEFIEDAAAAVKWVYDNISNYGQCEGIYIAGSSAGAYLAMLLCFDKSYLARHGIDSDKIDGYIFDSAQPTTHFRILDEKGLDTRRVVIDTASPIYHIRENPNLPRMMILVSDNDMPNRLEQTRLLLGTLKHFGCPAEKVVFKLMEGFKHTEYLNLFDEKGENIFVHLVTDFIGEAICEKA